MAKSLTVTAIKAAKHPGGDVRHNLRICDGGGLYLQVAPGNTKAWLFRYQLRGKNREMGLGACDPEGRDGLSLAEGREIAAAQRKLLQAGIDPIEARAGARRQEAEAREKAEQERREAEIAATEHSFANALEGCFQERRGRFSSPRYAQQWKSTVTRFALPTIGSMDVAKVTVRDILTILNPIWEKTPITASHTRQRLEAILHWSTLEARKPPWRSKDLPNPASWAMLKGELAPISEIHTTKHHPSLPWEQVPAFIAELGNIDTVAARCVAFVILTACRGSEARLAKWCEIDLENGVWKVPLEHMKKRRLHRAPLSQPTIDLLLKMRGAASINLNSLIFPPPYSGKVLGDDELSGLVKRMNSTGMEKGGLLRWHDDEDRAIDLHGFRTTFKSWVRKTSYPDELSELALAHLDRDKTRRAYAREDLLEERRPMMEAWANVCYPPVSTVVSIRNARRR